MPQIKEGIIKSLQSTKIIMQNIFEQLELKESTLKISKPDVFVRLQPFPDPIFKANQDHYMSFCELYSKDTSEKYHSSLLQKVNSHTSSSTTMAINGF
ncbi:396_t:CDS:2, partial [Cetraspora pellucida]